MATKTNHTTLVSIRLDNELLEMVDGYLKRSDYLTRSSVINYLLKFIFINASKEVVAVMIRKGWRSKREFCLNIDPIEDSTDDNGQSIV